MNSIWGTKALRRFVIMVACLALASVSAAGLTAPHQTQLTDALITLSSGFDQSANDSARAVLFDPAYSAGDFEAFFEGFFNAGGRDFTNSLSEILVNYAFRWNDPAPDRLKLQLALLGPLWNLATSITVAHPSDLGQFIYFNIGKRQSLFNVHAFHAVLAKEGLVGQSDREAVFARYKAYINANPQYFTDTWLDPALQPFVPELRGQVWISFTETLAMTQARRTEIADTLVLAGPGGKKRTLWVSRSLMVIDNNGYSEAHLDVMLGVLNAIPSDLLDPSQPGNLRYVYFRSAFQTTPDNESLFGRGGSEGVNYRIVKYGGDVTFEAVTEQGLESTARGVIESDRWSHVVAVRSGSTVSMYIDGALASTAQLSGTPLSTGSQDLYLGSDPRFFDEFKGSLDKVRVYSRALSANEVLTSYSGGAVSTANLAASYELDESAGTLVADASPNANNGIRQGASRVPGVAGNALWFDGVDDKVVIPDNASLAIDGDLTLEAWVYWVSETVYPNHGNADAVNLFAPAVGAAPGNEFPSDIAPVTMDGFTSILVHEFNHSVDHFSVQSVPANNARLLQLVQQAGTTIPQYLRSQIPEATVPDFFVNYPQEVFASISQEYFCDSNHTLRLALQRFDAGYREPLNQFLFFADIYSRGGNSTFFYRTDDNGHITRTQPPLRHGSGGVRLLAASGYRYKFTLDSNLNATAYDKAVDSDSDGLSDAEEIACGTQANAADSDGDGSSDLDEVWYDGDEAYNPFRPGSNPTGTDLDASNSDTDGDGLVDGWETGQTLDPLDATGDNGASGDPDADSYTNIEEQAGDSDPRDGDSVPVAMPVSTPGAIALTVFALLTLAATRRRRRT